MNPSDRDRNKDTQAFESPLIHEEELEHSATGDEDKETEEEGESPEVEENKETKEKTEVATKEAMLRVPSGQL
jgi:hypothetical protein